MLLCKRRWTRSEEFRQRYSFVFEKYRSTMFFWYSLLMKSNTYNIRDTLVLARKILLIVFSVFLAFSYLQVFLLYLTFNSNKAYLSFATLIIAYIIQRKCSPYAGEQINQAEKLSIYVSAGIMYTGLFFVRGIYHI